MTALGPRRLLLCVTRPALDALGELVEAWQHAAIDVEVELYRKAMPDVVALIARDSDLDAALFVSPARWAPNTILAGPVAADRDGRRIPIACLPFRDESSLRRFAATAAKVHRRAGKRRAVALLGQWLPNYLRVTDRMRSITGEGGVRAFRWTGDAITRESMVTAVGCGLGLGLYVGHGRPMGWVGYHGVRSHHFLGSEEARGSREPMGAILSLCCRTASRKRVGLSYTESLPLMGVAAASFGAVKETFHSDNTRWAVGVCTALTEGARTVGELLVRAAPASPAALASYRLIGDPFAPLGSDERSVRRANRIRTYE